MNFFVSASQDNTIKVWNIESFKKLINEDPEAQVAMEEIKNASLTVMGH